MGSGFYEVFSEGVFLVRNLKEIRTGQIKHPLDRTVYGRGYLGIGEYTYEENKKRSYCWRAMFKRCYEENGNYLPYTEVGVSEDWCNFQNFAKWYDENYVDGWELDKDLKSLDLTKEYSEGCCIFIPPELNKRLSHTYESVPNKEGRKYRAKVSRNLKSIELGRYFSWENALAVQVIAKFSMLQQELCELFGESFVYDYWNENRLQLRIEQGVASAKR
jgi:hypothetical protein